MAASSTQKATRFAPATAHDRRIDLAIDGEMTSIKLSSWVDGLGWCGQKTLELDPEMLDDLHKLVGAARIRLRHQITAERSVGNDRKILDFPVMD